MKRKFIKLILARANSWSQGALCGMGEVYVKWAAVHGWKTSVCLTCPWRLLSSWEKQVYPGLWSRIPWINRVEGRGMEKGGIKSLKKIEYSSLLLSWRCWGPAWQDSFCLPNTVIIWMFYFSIFWLQFCCCSPVLRDSLAPVISSKKFTGLVNRNLVSTTLCLLCAFCVLYLRLHFGVLNKLRGCVKCCLFCEVSWATAIVVATSRQYIWDVSSFRCLLKHWDWPHTTQKELWQWVWILPTRKQTNTRACFFAISPDSWSLEIIISMKLNS